MSTNTKDMQTLATEWIESWNRHDLESIMAHYADDVVFEANTVVKRWNRPDGKLRSAQELREHFRRGLELAPALHFELEAVMTAPSGYAALYHRDNGNRVIDVVELNAANKAIRVKAYYMETQA
jgi:ketosteroid isomerase-like protein